ncbi:phage tail protein [Mycolicibacterium fluoranthenivorans]|uniref:Minor tail protein n=1 Tax=Mycolicibacterium fluoranthenivorans TaxID=258505 RepID=A0A7X5U438_9MYCO|nr:phage tail protein [Mycolicibacterium fluoranthenivorans]MCV7358471.1 phage tail protein [Mycolicibacterium fluoranthenivorans]NIH98047.1 hypothetical protein [Mycolicibacterium fluoranthenivorans]
MTIPLGEPTFIGNADVRLGFWGMPRQAGDPRRVGGTFTVVNGEGELLLDVFIGPKGDPGEPMPVMDVQWDSSVATIGDLPDVTTLNESDNGRAWIIGTTWYVYVDKIGTDGTYKAVDAGIPGPRGITPDVNFTASFRETSDPDDDDINVTPAGTLVAPWFNIEFPSEKLRGPVGPSTILRGAPDYDNTLPPQDGQGIVWSDLLGKFKPGDLSPTAATMVTIPEANFTAYQGNAGRQLLASLDLDPLAYAWYPDVTGHLYWARYSPNILSPSSAQVEIEVRIGITGASTGENEPLCGLGRYDPSTLDSLTVSHIHPHFSDTEDPTRAVGPDSGTGRVPAGQAMTLYVFGHKKGGTGSWKFTTPQSQVRLLQFPVS